MGDLLSTVVGTLILSAVAVGIFATIWIGANVAVNQAQQGWSRYQAVATGFGAFLITAIMSGNRAFDALLFADNDNGLLELIGFVILPLIVGAIAAGLVIASGTLGESARLPAFAGAGALGGVGLALLFEESATPEIDYVGLIVCTLIGVAIGYGWGTFRGGVSQRTLLLWGAIGWTIGAFGFGETGGGGVFEAILSVAPPLAMLAARIGLREEPSIQELRAFDERARRYIFLAPALGFVSIALIIPTLRTIWLSLLDRRSEEFVWFENYVEIFTSNEGQQPTFRLDDWSNLFTSRLFWLAVILIGVGSLVGTATGRSRATSSPVPVARSRRSPSARSFSSPVSSPCCGARCSTTSGGCSPSPSCRPCSASPSPCSGRRCALRERRQVVHLHADGHQLRRRRHHLAASSTSPAAPGGAGPDRCHERASGWRSDELSESDELAQTPRGRRAVAGDRVDGCRRRSRATRPNNSGMVGGAVIGAAVLLVGFVPADLRDPRPRRRRRTEENQAIDPVRAGLGPSTTSGLMIVLDLDPDRLRHGHPVGRHQGGAGRVASRPPRSTGPPSPRSSGG